jgi:hypothetical protein
MLYSCHDVLDLLYIAGGAEAACDNVFTWSFEFEEAIESGYSGHMARGKVKSLGDIVEHVLVEEAIYFLSFVEDF